MSRTLRVVVAAIAAIMLVGLTALPVTDAKLPYDVSDWDLPGGG